MINNLYNVQTYSFVVLICTIGMPNYFRILHIFRIFVPKFSLDKQTLLKLNYLI